MILIDTDIAIEILREYGPAIEWFNALPRTETLLNSGYTAFELVLGTGNANELRRARKWLSLCAVAWLVEEGCRRALEAFARSHLSHGTGVLDALIAQTAVELRVPLQTSNVKHYRAFGQLRTVHPYRRA